MGIIDLFSKRGKPPPDVYVYDELPQSLRNQITHILDDAIGPNVYVLREPVWTLLAKAIAREHGLQHLPTITRFGRGPDHYGDCMDYVLQAKPAHALDLVELAFRLVDGELRNDLHHQRQRTPADEAIAELNHRFRECGCGFQFEKGQFVRVDSHLLHDQAVRPALALLSADGFDGPNQEFLSAHEHFRHGRIEAAITDACKAFESTLKAICDARRWRYDKSATAKPLIKTVIDKGLVPAYSDEQLNAVLNCLMGIATIRNKNAGHGAGARARDVPKHYAAYALHLAASNIVFLVECHKAK